MYIRHVPENSAPLAPSARAERRYRHLVRLHAEHQRIALLIRQETAALVDEDTAFAGRGFVADELSMALGESKRTCQTMVESAQVLMAHPAVVARLGASVEAGLTDPVVTGMFGIRHADAVLDELVGASAEVQEQVLDLVLNDESARTPHQLRKATRAARLVVDLDADQDKQDRLHDQRGVSLRDEADGSASVLIGGRKSGAAAIMACIDAHVGAAEPGDTRSLHQRRYDWLTDLLLGRTEVTEHWQALIVVSLETLEGGDAPAEIPGLGLVSADEAREILAQASLRRAVVNEHGELVSLDDEVLHGDLHQEDRARAARREARLMTLCHHGLRQIEQHLQAQAESRVSTSSSARAISPTSINDDPPDDEPDPPPDGGGSGPPRPSPSRPGGDEKGTPAGPPPQVDAPDAPAPNAEEPPPTWADRDWLEAHEDRAGTHDRIDQQAHRRNGCDDWQDGVASDLLAPSLRRQQWREDRARRQLSTTAWTTPALRAAVTQLRTAALTPVPVASKGYPFRGRLARWIKTRDVTCTFPGCHLLAQRCELDHVVAFPRGLTEARNGACECVHHHQCKHAVMTVVRLADGTVRWTNRFGVTVDRRPRPLLRGW